MWRIPDITPTVGRSVFLHILHINSSCTFPLFLCFYSLHRNCSSFMTHLASPVFFTHPSPHPPNLMVKWLPEFKLYLLLCCFKKIIKRNSHPRISLLNLGRGRKRNTEWVASCTHPHWGSNLQPSGVRNATPNNWATQAGLSCFQQTKPLSN